MNGAHGGQASSVHKQGQVGPQVWLHVTSPSHSVRHTLANTLSHALDEVHTPHCFMLKQTEAHKSMCKFGFWLCHEWQHAVRDILHCTARDAGFVHKAPGQHAFLRVAGPYDAKICRRKFTLARRGNLSPATCLPDSRALLNILIKSERGREIKALPGCLWHRFRRLLFLGFDLKQPSSPLTPRLWTQMLQLQ